MTSVSVIKEEKRVSSHSCHRCGGLMIREKVLELGSFDWHCVSCGERVDRVILAHRQAQGSRGLVREEAEKLFTGKGKARLN
jgi:predicted RNA-binding Zn-ribbon protein involved in translation (DUF1610 family)